MDFKKHPITQSLIKRFLYRGEEREKYCPKRIYHESIIKDSFFTSEAMTKGSYFETLCLGSGAKGKKVTDLPRKNMTKARKQENLIRTKKGLKPLLGEKTIDHERIDHQAERFKKLIPKYNIVLSELNVQSYIKIRWEKNPEVYLAGEFDIFPTTIMYKKSLRLALIDLKLTKSLDTTFGEFCYGAPEYLDTIQGDMYNYLIRQYPNNLDIPENADLIPIINHDVFDIIKNGDIYFFYWIFNYNNKELTDKLIYVSWSKEKELEVNESIRKTVRFILDYEEQGWPANPDYSLCKNCNVTNCDARSHIQEL